MAKAPSLDGLSGEQFGYLTTTGRVTGEPREIEIWFGVIDGTIYMLSGGRDRSNWVRNLMQTSAATMRIASTTFAGTSRIVTENTEEDAAARKLLVEKYQPGHDSDLKEWGETALPIALDIDN